MNYNILQKRLIYKSNNRGWKETDILLGSFTEQNINKLTEDQLKMLDLLLDEPDVEIFNWITKKVETPKKHNNEVMQLLQNFALK